MLDSGVQAKGGKKKDAKERCRKSKVNKFGEEWVLIAQNVQSHMKLRVRAVCVKQLLDLFREVHFPCSLAER